MVLLFLLQRKILRKQGVEKEVYIRISKEQVLVLWLKASFASRCLGIGEPLGHELQSHAWDGVELDHKVHVLASNVSRTEDCGMGLSYQPKGQEVLTLFIPFKQE